MFKKLFGILFICMLLNACSSTRTDRSVLEHQEQIDRLKSELRCRDRAIDNAVRELESITKRSSGMEGTIDDVIELFDEYQRTIERLLYNYRNAESTFESSNKIHSDIGDSLTTKDCMHDIRFHFLCEGGQIATVAGYTVMKENNE